MSEIKPGRTGKFDGMALGSLITLATYLCGRVFGGLLSGDDGIINVGSCKNPGRGVTLEERNQIVRDLGKYGSQLNLDLKVDPKEVVCAVDKDGQIRFHVEKDKEKLVDTVTEYVESN